MQIRFIVSLLIIATFTACSPNTIQAPTSSPASTATEITTTPDVISTPAKAESTASLAMGPEPSDRVAAFYYPWYGNPTTDGEWVHWTQNNHLPPDDIASDYYPAPGAYSSNDPAVVAQHMQWLRRAGVGVIISSWWGQGSWEDQAVPLLLQMGEQYGIQVAFHIEPYNGRNPESLIGDIQYLYRQYGNSPAFFRSLATSRYSPDRQPKGMFFVWSIEGRSGENGSYWQAALDQIHELPESGLVIANSLDARWIEGSHFDGLYNYVSLHLEEGGFDWARSLPPETLYVPSVIPGFSARRVGYAEDTFVPREEGSTFSRQWDSALNAGVEPALVTVTSFNEWHEGSMIEPARSGVNDGNGYTYEEYGALSPEGYLDLTREWADKYLAMSWSSGYRARIKIATTSDWTTLELLNNGAWIRPERIQISPSATIAGFEQGDRFVLMQSLADASAGNQVEMTWDVLFIDLAPGKELALQIERGNIGKTQVTISNYTGANPVEVKSFEWEQVTTDRNSYQITIPAELLID